MSKLYFYDRVRKYIHWKYGENSNEEKEFDIYLAWKRREQNNATANIIVRIEAIIEEYETFIAMFPTQEYESEVEINYPQPRKSIYDAPPDSMQRIYMMAMPELWGFNKDQCRQLHAMSGTYPSGRYSEHI